MRAVSHCAVFAFLVFGAFTLTSIRAYAQDVNPGDVVLELRDGGFVRGRLISGARGSGDVVLLRVDGVRIRYARSELRGVTAHEPRGLVDARADRPGLFLELVNGPETPQLAIRTRDTAMSSSTQIEAMPAIARSDRLRLCALPCTLSLVSGVYQFAIGTTSIHATPPLPSVALSPGDALNVRYLDGQPARTAGLILFATTAVSLLGSTALLLGPAYGLDGDLSLGLGLAAIVVAAVQAVISIMLLLRDDDARIEVRRGAQSEMRRGVQSDAD